MALRGEPSGFTTKEHLSGELLQIIIPIIEDSRLGTLKAFGYPVEYLRDVIESARAEADRIESEPPDPKEVPGYNELAAKMYRADADKLEAVIAEGLAIESARDAEFKLRRAAE
jgi:hypothetical protein